MIKLFNHQKIALSYLRTNDSFALFMEQGTGKTLVALFRILDLLRAGQIEEALIVAPKSALGSWERDIEIFDDINKEMLKEGITLINYDKVWRKKKNEKQSPFFKKWGCIVLDEAHYIKNRNSNRSKFILKLAIMADYRYILTGTPIGNGKLEQIWSQYAFLNPELIRGRVGSKIFGGTYPKFSDKYCILNQYYEPRSYKNVSELQNKINEHCYRVKKSDCLDLPEKLPDEVLQIELKEKKLYKELLKSSAILDMDILAENAASRSIKLRQVCSGFIKDNDGNIKKLKSNKIETLKNFLDNYDKKLVIFAEFKQSIKDISELLNKLKITYVVLDGEQKNKNIWREFQKDKSIQIIVCQYKSAAAGIDLFAADTIIYYEPTIESNTLEQSRDRIHRTGQTHKCSYIHFITKGTIEEDIYKALINFSDFSNKLFIKYMDNYTRSYCK